MNKTKEWVPEFKYETYTGTFKDYRGNNRDFTMVAVSIPMDETENPRVVKTVEMENEMDFPDKEIHNENGDIIDFIPGYTHFYKIDADIDVNPVVKMLSVGVAVRAVRDNDLGIGERIAYGKAVKLRNHVLFATHPGMINTKMVKAFLEQEAEHFKKDPGSYLTAYNADKFRYVETGKIADAEKTYADVECCSVDVGNKFPNPKDIPVKERLIKESNS